MGKERNSLHRHNRTTQLVMDSVLAAMVVVLGFVSINLGNVMKISLEDFPVIFAALMFGPVDGMIVAGIGIFLYQLLSYGITATTALWIFPFIAAGAIAGLYAKKWNYSNSARQLMFIFIVSELIVFLLNTVAIYADSKIYGYYYPTIITGMILVRFVTALAKGVILGFISQPVLKRLSKFTGNGLS
ncbi:MAG: ECF transporter S component [Mogibacterium sp.]|nr:ECF transporter S component [Mogibacterium sp.]